MGRTDPGCQLRLREFRAMACFGNRKGDFHLRPNLVISFSKCWIRIPAFFQSFERNGHQVTLFARSSARSSHLCGVFCPFFMNAATITIRELLAVTYRARPSFPLAPGRISHILPRRCLTCGSRILASPTNSIRSTILTSAARTSTGHASSSSEMASFRISTRHLIGQHLISKKA